MAPPEGGTKRWAQAINIDWEKVSQQMSNLVVGPLNYQQSNFCFFPEILPTTPILEAGAAWIGEQSTGKK